MFWKMVVTPILSHKSGVPAMDITGFDQQNTANAQTIYCFPNKSAGVRYVLDDIHSTDYTKRSRLNRCFKEISADNLDIPASR